MVKLSFAKRVTLHLWGSERTAVSAVTEATAFVLFRSQRAKGSLGLVEIGAQWTTEQQLDGSTPCRPKERGVELSVYVL